MSGDNRQSDASRRRFNFPYHVDVQTRWLDNDQYGHLNNSSYYLIADSINNSYLYDYCGIVPFISDSEKAHQSHSQQSPSQPLASSVVGLVISSSAQFFAQTSFPDTLRGGLRVVQLGSSSVTYEIGIFALPAKGTEKRSSSLSTLSSSQGGNTSATQSQLSADVQAAAIVRVTHVFVDRHTRRPVKPMPEQVRRGLERLCVRELMAGDKADGKARL